MKEHRSAIIDFDGIPETVAIYGFVHGQKKLETSKSHSCNPGPLIVKFSKYPLSSLPFVTVFY